MATRIIEKTSPMTDEYLAAIGKAVISWSRFELILDLHISMLCGVPHPNLGMCVTAQVPISGRKFDAIIALFGEHGASKEASAPLRALAGRADELQRKRNRYIHDGWSFGSETKSAYRLEVTAAKALTFEHKVVPLSELADFARDVEALSEKFMALWNTLAEHESVLASLAEMFRETAPAREAMSKRRPVSELPKK